MTGNDRSKFVPMQVSRPKRPAPVPMTPASFRAAMKAAIAREMSNLVEHDGGAAGWLLELYCDTWAALPDGDWRKVLAVCRLSANSAFNPSCGAVNPARDLLPEPLQRRWQEWRGRWERLLADNPRLELAEHLEELSESHLFTSCPCGLEDVIEDWVLGAVEDYPLDDHKDVVTPALRARLAELRERTGGWLWYSEATGVAFLPQPEWLIQRQKMQADRENVQRSVEEMKAVMARWKAKGEEPT